MRNPIPTLLTLCLITADATAQSNSREVALRAAIRFPSMQSRSSIKTGSGGDFLSHGQPPPSFKQEIASLRASLRGDESDADRWFEIAVFYQRSEDSDQAAKAYGEAGAIYRKRVAADPKNGHL